MKMRKMRFAAGVSALAVLIGTGAMAQQAPGHFLNDFPAKIAGHLSGLEVYHHPETDFLWVKLPDGNVVGGYVFDAGGKDIGAAITGSEAVTAQETIASAIAENPLPSEIATNSGFVPLATGLVAAAPTADAASQFTIPAEAAQGVVDQKFIDEMLAHANQAMANASDQQKAAWMAELIGHIDQAETPTHLQLSLIEWAERVQGKEILDAASRQKMQDVIAQELQNIGDAGAPAMSIPPITIAPTGTPSGLGDIPKSHLDIPTSGFEPVSTQPSPAFMPVTPIIPEVTTTVLPAAAPAKNDAALTSSDIIAEPQQVSVAGSISETQAFFDAMQTEAAWLELGDANAPIVYMYADPLCPYCARAFSNLEADINGGQLRLRVILAPLVNSKSGDTIAGILSQANPSRALFDHEIELARYGASSLKPVDFGSLDPQLSERIKFNYDLAGQYKIPGVPFFAWQTNAGVKMLSGVPEAGHFKATAIQMK